MSTDIGTLIRGSFSIERTFVAAEQEVFTGWAVPELKRRWYAEAEGFRAITHELDFRIGGLETCVGRKASGRRFSNTAVYHDIVPDQRLVFSYSLTYDDVPVSVSVATVELEPRSDGTRLRFTEHGVFLREGHEPKGRESGWRWLLDRLADEIHGMAREGRR